MVHDSEGNPINVGDTVEMVNASTMQLNSGLVANGLFYCVHDVSRNAYVLLDREDGSPVYDRGGGRRISFTGKRFRVATPNF